MECPNCGSTDIIKIIGNLLRCRECGTKFMEDEEREKREECEERDPDDEEDDTGDNVGDPDDMDAIFMDVI